MMYKQILLVGLGGGIGSIFRYLTSVFVGKLDHGNFPLTTFVANILGCLLIGVLIGVFIKNSPNNESLRLLFITGFCGGYTTFSTFAFENIQLFQQQQYFTLFFYTLGSLLIGFLAVGLGLYLTKI